MKPKQHILFILLLNICSISLHAQFLNLEGTSSKESIRFVKQLDGFLYQGVALNDDESYLVKKDLTGNKIWSLSVADKFSANDIAKQGDTLLIVGSFRDQTSFVNAGLVSLVDNGNSGSVVQSAYYNIFDRRSNFTRVIANPSSANTFIVQHYSRAFDSGQDKVAFIEFNGGLIEGFHHLYDNADDQFWIGLKSGEETITICNNNGSTAYGGYMEVDANFDVTKSYEYSELDAITDYLDRSPNRKIVVGRSDNVTSFIGEIDQNGDFTWAKEIIGGDYAFKLFLGSSITNGSGYTETYYALNREVLGGNQFKYVVHKIKNENNGSGSTITIEWTRHLDDGSANQSPGASMDISSGKILYADSRENPTQGFGNYDIATLITDLEYTSCVTTDLSYTLADITTTKSSLTFAKTTGSLPAQIPMVAGTTPSESETTICEFDFSCETDTLIINSGYDHINQNTHAIMQQDGLWILEDAPTNNGMVNLGSPAYAINKNGAWSDPGFNSTYISAFPVAGMNEKNLDPSIAPYKFRRCFCVEADNTVLEFDIDIHVDNRMQMYFYDPSGVVPRFLLDEVPGSSSGNFNGPPEHLTIADYTVATAGTYCLEAEMRNDHAGSPMGMNIEGWIKGASLLSDTCCSTQAYIAGFKFRDEDCDGNVSFGDPTVSGYEIELYDSTGALLSSMTTDDNGYYVFAVDPGTYSIKEVLQPDWEFSTPANGEYNDIIVGINEVGQYNFGNIFTGPIVTEDLESSCAQVGDEIEINWQGQVCDCDITLEIELCNSGSFEPLATFSNSGSYSWVIPEFYNGEYSFQLVDCDGNKIPVNGCVNIQDYNLALSATQVDCGTYDFNVSYENILPEEISSYTWNFGSVGGASDATPTHAFENPGEYEIKVTIETTTGCVLSETMTLEVTEGANDPTCEFCEALVHVEVDQADLFINDNCYGMIIKSPNGNCFRIKVDDDGTLFSQAIDCPTNLD